MIGNVCPKCGEAVMTYSRFFREAEPGRISRCGNCNAELRRSKSVYVLLLAMSIVLIITALGLFSMFDSQAISMAAMVILGVIILVGAILVTNYLGFLLIGWKPSQDR